jgi:hypothetical protein
VHQRLSFVSLDLLRILWITLEVAALKNRPIYLAKVGQIIEGRLCCF